METNEYETLNRDSSDQRYTNVPQANAKKNSKMSPVWLKSAVVVSCILCATLVIMSIIIGAIAISRSYPTDEQLMALEDLKAAFEEKFESQQRVYEMKHRNLTDSYERLQSQQVSLVNRIRDNKTEIIPIAAFNAKMSHNGTLDYRIHSKGDRIIFDVIIYNNRGAYNSSNGIFTCLESGIYLFAVSFLSRSATFVHVKITKKATPFAYAFTYQPQSVTLPVQASATGVISCYAGERVWAEIYNSVPSVVIIYGWSSTFFTGVQIG